MVHASFLLGAVHIYAMNKQNICTRLLAKQHVDDRKLAKTDNFYGGMTSGGFMIVSQQKLF